jgi:NAD(P)H dehydrogenase (quinone)
MRRANFIGLLTWTILTAAAALFPSGQSACGEETASSSETTVRVLVAYHSRTGNTERMAQAVAEGVRQVPGAVVVVKQVQAVTKADLEAADGIVLGSPTYFANIAGAMKLAIDDWNWKLKVDFTDKVGGAFATGGGQTGGKEHVVISLLLFLLNNRMVVAGPLYEDEEGDDIWGEVGSSAITGPLDPGLGPGEIDAARRLGERVARVAKKMKAGSGDPKRSP